MFNNYYFLRQLSRSLKERLVGMTLGACFSQSKDELMIGFYKGGREQWIRASLIPNFNLLTFPLDYQRKKVNSIDLFKDAIDEEVTDIIQYENERAFLIQLTSGWGLLFKMYGNRSNILLTHEGEVHAVFQKRHIEDQNMDISSLDRELNQTKEGFFENGLRGSFPTLGREVQGYLDTKGFEGQDQEAQWNLLSSMLNKLEQPNYYVEEKDDQVQFLLFKLDDATTLFETSDPIEAANEFYFRFSKRYFVEREKGPLIKEIDKRLKQSKGYLKKNYARYEELTENARFEEIANIIMANLHAIPPRTKKVKLFDFYKDEEISVKLNETLTPQKNAETYYRKAKNQKLEVKNLEANIQQKEGEMEELKKHRDALNDLEMVREIRKYIKTNNLQKLQKNEPVFPFRKFEYKGFEIWVGKNAVNNDLLTQRFAHKRDLWLHARDVAGSHVVVKWKSKQPNFPVDVIEKAASIAAYYSQRKTDTLCPVIYTPKKFVRKRKGDPAGLVVVDKEKVVLIEPAPFSETLT
ncbi:NFACT RNA binding domain-containing protein [Flammeovirga sp. SubArs3]|uniref:NFACT RNA binding domain-containing protein n=1 Tax=Flammeovirga sp. SubArs3 TaxID=2995316 RepID=UPI00248AF122|nr:NFACT RNA binding domain-containing protein [Flammeovirga sp. SubArs3]